VQGWQLILIGGHGWEKDGHGGDTLAAHGLEELFSSCAVVSVFGSGVKKILVLHTYVLRVQYSCGIVLVFWFWREIVFGVT
jgi:hypothetical protein